MADVRLLVPLAAADEIVKAVVIACGAEAAGRVAEQLRAFGHPKLPDGQMHDEEKERIRYVELASKHTKDGEVEVDSDAAISAGDDGGAYVSAWLWVYDPDAKDDDEP